MPGDSCLSTTPPAQPCHPLSHPPQYKCPKLKYHHRLELSTHTLLPLWSFQESRVRIRRKITFLSLWKSVENNLIKFKRQPAKHRIPLSKRLDQFLSILCHCFKHAIVNCYLINNWTKLFKNKIKSEKCILLGI